MWNKLTYINQFSPGYNRFKTVKNILIGIIISNDNLSKYIVRDVTDNR